MIDYWAVFQVYCFFATGTYTLLTLIQEKWFTPPRPHVLTHKPAHTRVQIGRTTP